MKIDVFPHIYPPKFRKAAVKAMGRPEPDLDAMRTLYDLDYRFKIMDMNPDVVHILNAIGGVDERVVGKEKATALIQAANDEMVELIDKYPTYFVAAVARVPMYDMDATMKEVERCIEKLNMKGILVNTSVHGKPLDSPEFMPLWEKMAKYNLPILIHPWRGPNVADYPTEKVSKYHIWSLWGWPYETTVAMTRLVFSGIFDRCPNIKFVTHHAGAMVSFLEKRIVGYWDYTEFRLKKNYRLHLQKNIVDYFKMFYNDTAIYGSTPGLKCAHAFFGTDHLLFGSDFPFDSFEGERYTRETIESIENMGLSPEDKKKLYTENARNLFKLPL